MYKELIIEKLNESKALLKEKYRISRVGLFGSYASNNQKEHSDIDIIYELVEEVNLGLKEVFELEVFFKGLFDSEKVDLVNKRYLNPIIESEMKKSVIYV